MHISLDFETFSEAPLKGKTSVGVWNYAAHPSTYVHCFAYSIDWAREVVWTRASGEPLPEWMLHPEEYDVEYQAWNAMFEYAILHSCLKIPTGPIESWWDTMALARKAGLPGKLETCTQAMKLAQDQHKDKRGTELIRKLCCLYRGKVYDKPDRDELLEELYGYCAQDVVAEKAVASKLPHMSTTERAVWLLDQKINYTGIPIDIPNVERAIDMYQIVQHDLDVRLRELTGLDNPNSTQQMAEWLRSQGVYLDNMQAATIDSLLKDDAKQRVGLELFG